MTDHELLTYLRTYRRQIEEMTAHEQASQELALATGGLVYGVKALWQGQTLSDAATARRPGHSGSAPQ